MNTQSVAPPPTPYEALRRIVTLLSEGDRLPRTGTPPREENAPIDVVETDPGGGLRGLGRAVEHLRESVGAAQAALTRLDDEVSGLTLVASNSYGISGPLLGPRHG